MEREGESKQAKQASQAVGNSDLTVLGPAAVISSE